jgi:hypothetical protein
MSNDQSLTYPLLDTLRENLEVAIAMFRQQCCSRHVLVAILTDRGLAIGSRSADGEPILGEVAAVSYDAVTDPQMAFSLMIFQMAERFMEIARHNGPHIDAEELSRLLARGRE